MAFGGPRRKSPYTDPVLLKKKIDELGWSQRQLADHVDVNYGTVSDWVNGKKQFGKVLMLYVQLLINVKNAKGNL